MSPSDLDRATLDANYNLRAAVPEHPAYFARYEVESGAFRQRAQSRLDLAYGDGPGQGIDLFLPQDPAPPLLVFIHGGYWQRFGRKDFSFVAAPLVAAGADKSIGDSGGVTPLMHAQRRGYAAMVELLK